MFLSAFRRCCWQWHPSAWDKDSSGLLFEQGARSYRLLALARGGSEPVKGVLEAPQSVGASRGFDIEYPKVRSGQRLSICCIPIGLQAFVPLGTHVLGIISQASGVEHPRSLCRGLCRRTRPACS